MADPGSNTPDQLDIVQQMNKALQEQTKILQQIAGAMGASASASEQLRQANDQQAETASNAADKTRELNEALEQNTEGAAGLASALGRSSAASGEMTTSFESAIDTTGDFITAAGVLSAGVAGVGEAMNATKITVGLFQGGISSMMGIVQGAIGVVGGFFSGLMQAAADYHNAGAGELFKANEAIRGSFGDLASNQGAAVKGMAKNLDTYKKAVKGAGASVFKTIGNMAAVLGEVKEVAEGFGNSFVRMQDQVVGATSEIFLMKKGLDVGADAMKQLASAAEAAGTTLKDQLQEAMVTAAHLSDQFGVDVKMIGKNFDQMAADVDNFGHLAPKTLMATAAYAAKLGVEVKSLTGLMEGFDTFESAAANAGKLAEAFGMNVDVMGMMNAENPAERMDMLRKSFEETGKSVNDLNRHELKMLSESMGGMPIDELKNSLSMSTDEMGFGDMADAAEEAAEKMTPEKAMEKAAKSIEKLANGMSKMTAGPFSEFMRGFKEAIERSPEFRQIMKDVAKWLKEFFKLGKAVGKMFVDTFLKKGSAMRDNIQGIFDLKKIKKFTGEVKKAFEQFFKLVKTDPKKAVEDLFDRVKKAFENWFGSGESVSSFGNMLKDMLIAGLKMVSGLAPKIIKTAAKYIQDLANELRDFLSGDKKTTDVIGEGLSGAFQEALTAISDTLVNDLWPALSDLFGQVFWAVAPYLVSILTPVWVFIFIKSLVSAAAAALAGAVFKGVAALLVKGLSKAFGGAAAKQLGTEKGVLNAKQGDKVAKGGKSFGKMLEAFKKISIGDIFKAAGILLVMAGTFSIAMVMLGHAMAEITRAFKGLSFPEVLTALGGITAAAIAAAILMKVVDKMGTPGASHVKGLLGLALVLTLAGVAVGIAAHVVMFAWQGIDVKQFMWTVSAITLAAILAIPLTIALMAMSAFVNPFAAAAVGIGILGLTAVLLATALLAIPATVFANAWGSVDTKAFMAGMSLLAATVGMTISFIGAMVGLGAFIVAFLVPLKIGIGAYFGFMMILAATSEGLAMFMNTFSKNFMKVDLPRLAAAYALLMGTVLGTIVIVGAGIVLGMMALSMWAASGGIWVAAAFWLSITIPLMSLAWSINKIASVVQDADKASKVMNIVGQILLSISKLADLGIKAQRFGKVTKVVGKGTGATEATNSISAFIVDTLGAMVGLLNAFKEVATSFADKKVLKGADAISGLIGAVGSLAGTLVGPLTEIIKNKKHFKKKDELVSAMQQGATMVGSVLKALRIQLPKIVESLLKALSGIKASPRTIKKKAEALKALFEGLAAMISAVNDIKDMSMRETKDGDKTTQYFDKGILMNMFRKINIIISDPTIGELIQNAVKITNQVKYAKTMAKRMKSIGEFVASTSNMVRTLSELGKFLKDGGTKGLLDLREQWDIVMDDSNNIKPSVFVADMQEEVKQIKKNWKGLNADLGNVKMKPLLNSMLGVKEGKYTISIVPESVELTVNMNVTMDSKELAIAIAKGNKDTDGFFKTTQKVDRAALDLSGGE